PAVRLTGSFGVDFAAGGLTAVWPEDDSGVLEMIRAVKAGRRPPATAMADAARGLLAAGADHILIACTELSLLTGDLPGEMPWTDSLDCLVRSIVAQGRA
ncbi:MAG: aspartate racemase, partial [Proteobacteria bacterium]|nr:aspartate racemase [Pseudomonadota bacterium]